MARTTGLVRRVTATVYITRRVCVLLRLRVIVGAPDESIDSFIIRRSLAERASHVFVDPALHVHVQRRHLERLARDHLV